MIEVIDSFLPTDVFKELQQHFILGGAMWQFDHDGVSHQGDGHMQFTNMFYENGAPQKGCELVFPLMNKLNAVAWIRVKANLLPKTDKHIEHGFHTDITNSPKSEFLKTGVFYVNNNNGYTKFEDGTKVDSVENRLVTFPNYLQHTGSTCTDEPARIVVNLNWLEMEESKE